MRHRSVGWYEGPTVSVVAASAVTCAETRTGATSTLEALCGGAATSSNRRVPVLLLLLSLVAVTAAERSGSLIPVPACAAVSRYDVQAALGSAVGKGAEEYGKHHTTCDYAGRNGLVTITIHRLPEPVSLQAQQQDLRSAFPNAEFKTTSIGDAKGFFMHLPKAGTQLHLLCAPNQYVLISILGFGEAHHVANAAESMARKVIDSL